MELYTSKTPPLTITLEPGGQRMVVNLQVEANLDLQLTRVFDRIE